MYDSTIYEPTTRGSAIYDLRCGAQVFTCTNGMISGKASGTSPGANMASNSTSCRHLQDHHRKYGG